MPKIENKNVLFKLTSDCRLMLVGKRMDLELECRGMKRRSVCNCHRVLSLLSVLYTRY